MKPQPQQANKQTMTTKNTYNPDDYSIDKWCPVKRIVRPGEYLFIPCYTRRGNFFVRAQIEEMVYIHAWDEDKNKKSVWKHMSIDNWDDGISLKEIEDSCIMNQFPWVDWPIGHAAYIGSEGFFTLEEARKACGRGRKKGKYRHARNYLSRTMGFVYHTHEMAKEADEPAPEWPWPSRKSFYRKIYI